MELVLRELLVGSCVETAMTSLSLGSLSAQQRQPIGMKTHARCNETNYIRNQWNEHGNPQQSGVCLILFSIVRIDQRDHR